MLFQNLVTLNWKEESVPFLLEKVGFCDCLNEEEVTGGMLQDFQGQVIKRMLSPVSLSQDTHLWNPTILQGSPGHVESYIWVFWETKLRSQLTASINYQAHERERLQMIKSLPSSCPSWHWMERRRAILVGLSPDCMVVDKQGCCCHLKPLNFGGICYATMVTETLIISELCDHMWNWSWEGVRGEWTWPICRHIEWRRGCQ